jgi:thiamine pyrophosphate-dependent acetolactate synthase large subunit-like protein
MTLLGVLVCLDCQRRCPLAALALAFGVAYARVESIDSLAQAIARGIAQPGLTLVHAVVEAHAVRSLEAELARVHAAHLAERRKEKRWTT